MFGIGYDISSEEGFNEFESVIGFKYLKALHINDSKGMLLFEL